MEKKEAILHLYYSNHLKISEITYLLDISSAYVSKVITKDSRYKEEKLYRKNITKINRQNYQKKFIKDKRYKKRIEDNYSIVQEQHIQASKELSKRKHLTNENYRKWNSSAYKYVPSKKRYEFDKELGRSYDVPKYIKER